MKAKLLLNTLKKDNFSETSSTRQVTMETVGGQQKSRPRGFTLATQVLQRSQARMLKCHTRQDVTAAGRCHNVFLKH